MNPTGRRCAWHAPATIALLGQLACRGTSIATPVVQPPQETWPVLAADLDPLCADVGTLRACWTARAIARGVDGGAAGVVEMVTGPGVVRVVERTVPAAPPASPMGWRCAGQGHARICADRARSAPPFVCVGRTCTQRHPRMPDDGEWTCAEMAGAQICAGGERAAGVAPAPADPAWLCGTRRGGPPDDGAGPRVCIDFAPDFPDGNLGAWRCHQDNQAPASRVCEQRGQEHWALLTDPCDRARPCVDGSACVAGRCLPERPSPSCWLDTDCPRGACRFGSCAGETTR